MFARRHQRGGLRLVAFSLAALAIAVAGSVVPAQAGSWKGNEVTDKGVLHVVNPAQGIESPLTVKLEELWRIGGDTDDEDEFFGVINRIAGGPDGNLYILDSQLAEVKVFSPDGEYLRTIGREGEGPGEFRRPSDMTFLPDGSVGVVQIAPARIVMLSPDGEPAGEHPLPATDNAGGIFLLNAGSSKDHVVLAYMTNEFGDGSMQQHRTLACIDEQGNEVGKLHTESRSFAFANALIEEKVWDTFDRRWSVGPDGRIFAVTTHADYEIHVWKPGGELDRVITRDYKRLARDEEAKAVVHGIYEAFTRQVPGATIKVENDYKDINTIYPRQDGSLWVLTSRGATDLPDGVVGVFDVFDKKGRFVREVTLKGEGDTLNDGYFFVGDRLYVVTDLLQALMAQQGGGDESTQAADEEAEPMSIVCYRVDAPNMGASE